MKNSKEAFLFLEKIHNSLYRPSSSKRKRSIAKTLELFADDGAVVRPLIDECFEEAKTDVRLKDILMHEYHALRKLEDLLSLSSTTSDFQYIIDYCTLRSNMHLLVKGSGRRWKKGDGQSEGINITHFLMMAVLMTADAYCESIGNYSTYPKANISEETENLLINRSDRSFMLHENRGPEYFLKLLVLKGMSLFDGSLSDLINKEILSTLDSAIPKELEMLFSYSGGNPIINELCHLYPSVPEENDRRFIIEIEEIYKRVEEQRNRNVSSRVLKKDIQRAYIMLEKCSDSSDFMKQYVLYRTSSFDQLSAHLTSDPAEKRRGFRSSLKRFQILEKELLARNDSDQLKAWIYNTIGTMLVEEVRESKDDYMLRIALEYLERAVNLAKKMTPSVYGTYLRNLGVAKEMQYEVSGNTMSLEALASIESIYHKAILVNEKENWKDWYALFSLYHKHYGADDRILVSFEKALEEYAEYTDGEQESFYYFYKLLYLLDSYCKEENKEKLLDFRSYYAMNCHFLKSREADIILNEMKKLEIIN